MDPTYPLTALALAQVPVRSFGELFLTTGFVGPLLALAALAALALALWRWLELRPARLAPAELQRELEGAVHDGRLEGGLERAQSSHTLLGELVAAGLYLRRAGLDEMLANVERATAKELQRAGDRIAHLARLGGVVLLVGAFGTTVSLINQLAVIKTLKAPNLQDFAYAIGDSLTSGAFSLFVALGCFVAFFWLDSRLTQRTLAVREIAEELMRDAADRGNRASG